MPRHTRPPVRQRHPRAVTRANWERVTASRRREAQDRYPHPSWLTLWPRPASPLADQLLELLQGRPYVTLHPDEALRLPRELRGLLWFTGWERNRWSRNPWTRCSCAMCRWPDLSRRAREQRAAAQQVREALEEIREEDGLS